MAYIGAEGQDYGYRASSGVNPLVWAAGNLLNAIPQIRGMVKLEEPGKLKEKLATEIRHFEDRAKSVGVSREELIGARYCLCTALDEAAAQTPWGGRGIWVKNSLLVLFHNETEGGEKYYQLLARLAQNPERYKNLIELLYYCNALGFEGRFRISENGYSQLEILKRRIATILGKVKGGYEKRLSAHWVGVDSVKPAWSLVPPWVVAAFCGLIAIGCYMWFRFSVEERSDVAYSQLAAIRIPSSGLTVAVPAPRSGRLRQFLEAEIREGLLEVRDEAAKSVVILTGDGLFNSGSTEIKAGYIPVLRRVAAGLAQVNGGIAVTGYTDNVPIRRTLAIASNQELSVERARAVEALLKQNAALGGREIQFDGRGEAEPLADNKTPEGRAKNRRVEIAVLLTADDISQQLNGGSEQ